METHGEGIQGTSLNAMNVLAKEKDYTLVAYTGNAIYVRNDLYKKSVV